MSEIAPDGSPVLLYARLPSFGEAALIHEAVPAGGQILELGAGAGRITQELIALGHDVVAVDNSSACSHSFAAQRPCWRTWRP